MAAKKREDTAAPGPPKEPGDEYVVVARRYRPQQFGELIGQVFVGKALSTAIETDRVGHAYLFTGARGVGKTSAARILAKALNCQRGMSPRPCDECDICESVGRGNDVDVLEIDGASNRGIDEIRQLREGVHIRPSRARFKIYIIDEVHMLTREAFNALLKTLEEPPDHVKFIFCTTEANKIPITILSRCQRFDFSGIQTASIAERLRQIVAQEGVEADADALALLARRAAGSMRDSQSLLEQVMAFGGEKITLQDVHQLLGTADDAKLMELVERLVAGDAQGALTNLDRILTSGVDVGQLLDQIFGYVRDLMATAVGCDRDILLHSSPEQHDRLVELARSRDVSTFLAALQILEQTLARLRQSVHARTLAELALTRICLLGELAELSRVVADLQSDRPAAGPRPGVVFGRAPLGGGSPPSANVRSGSEAPKKNGPPPSLSRPPDAPTAGANGMPRSDGAGISPSNPTETAIPVPSVDLTPANAESHWRLAAERLPGLLGQHAAAYSRITCAAPDRLAVEFAPNQSFAKSCCERPDQAQRICQSLAEVLGRPIAVEFLTTASGDAAGNERTAAAKRPNLRQKQAERASHPMVTRARELFDAHIVSYQECREP